MIEDSLSEQGRKRREQILQLAQREARLRVRRRLANRGWVTAAIAGVGVLIFTHRPQEKLAPVAPPVIALVPPPPTRLAPPTAFEYVQSDPTITARLTVPSEPPRWTSIDDHELVEELAAAGQPVGIACINGKTILLPREETR